jgi:hypothetical protein
MDILVIPHNIPRHALLSIIPSISLLMYISYKMDHRVLFSLLSILCVTSILYWNNSDWITIMYIDMAVAISVLCTISYIAITQFTPMGIGLWFAAIGIMSLSFVVNREILKRRVCPAHDISTTLVGTVIDTYYPVSKTEANTTARTDAYEESTHMHMCFVHILMGLTFTVGAWLSYKKR